ncbi:Ig-like domain-containing protein [Endozoicomonas sp. SESOKO1]|uniref:Ig-like domain-containing protein n=1 Tax=Endozoicomonas sp. SESOKO1 TaxID=2828742 RepID=UPI0035A05472
MDRWLPADGNSWHEVRARVTSAADGKGDPVPYAKVSVSNSSSFIFQQRDVYTDINGYATFRVASTEPSRYGVTLMYAGRGMSTPPLFFH